MSCEPAGAVGRALAHVASVSSGPPLDRALRVTLNFHPDRITAGQGVLERLAADGRYLSQFVTGTSNGGLTAYPGGDRWRWEHRIFAGAYDDADPADRPVYGALNFRARSVGGAQRFGSAHLRLTAETLDRTTFCFPDSTFEPGTFGVASRMGLIGLADAAEHDLLDDYIEAQVHGPVRIDRDVEALVLDPCYRDGPIEQAARKLVCSIEWHRGFRLSVEEMRHHAGYRGPEFVELGAAIATGGVLDPKIISEAANSGRYDLQAIKRVWHLLARFGGPDQDRRSDS
ncbi:DUF3626 domain-containing protein [Microlunatus elymi]|uniref:DUF3626 domain-containing protein n=1 Tax=Microlunatus elymi TaxID=2596828 RepID=A0A516Q0W1_9ACTN|nr:DUF3626 domain-containing protein [Microlunatus elymi]QDP97069.1 DUF3626 domain-containing protein [Microlunatus elymi]